MNLVETIKGKVESLGLQMTAGLLGVKPGALAWALDGRGGLGDAVCQKALDLWLEGPAVTQIDPIPEKSVCLLLPWYKSVSPKTAFCLLHQVMNHKNACRIQERDGDAMITRSRNHLARRFLRDTECEWSLWVDDDMVLPIGNAAWFNGNTGMNLAPQFAGMDTIPRLLSWGKTMVGALYYDRHGKDTATVGYDGFLQVRPPHNSIQPVKFIGTGCLLVHRKVYTDVAAMFPEVLDDKMLGNESGFFTPIQTKQRMMGEDEAFGWRAVQAGHQTFMDMGLICGHVGSFVYGLPKK